MDDLDTVPTNDSYHSFTGDENCSECTQDAKRHYWRCFSVCLSMLKYARATLELSVMCGILFGLFATLLWWVQLNLVSPCTGDFDSMPKEVSRFRSIADAVRVMMIIFWPILTIVPICSWSMIRDSNILFWCTIAGCADVIDRLYLFIFGHYETHFKTYVGNVLFLLISLMVFHKFAKYRLKQGNKSGNSIIITLKLSSQLLFGLVLFLPYNYVFLNLYEESTQLIRTILSCALIAVFYGPKLIIGGVVINLHDIYKPREGIVFAAAFLMSSTMVLRLTQARIESLGYFTAICFVHGIANVIDKMALPVREKLCDFFSRRRNARFEEYELLDQEYISHQSLVSAITETTSVILSNATAYLLVYHYRKEEERSVLIREMLLRLSIAVSIEWI